ncbi:MAG TPA: OmpA family protein [Thermodesulfobacteriota bacterium]|nr:OmpA family protein [Thermodesulfobacteriota bacterium]
MDGKYIFTLTGVLTRVLVHISFILLFSLFLSFSSGCLPPQQPPAEEYPLETPIPAEPPREDAEPAFEIEETDKAVKVELSGDILFGFNESNIRASAEPILLKVAEVINKYPDASVLIEGHTDSIGSNAYNLQLSRKRAESVKNWLAQQGGVDAKRVMTKGLGESKPVAPNENPDGSDNPEGRQENRRVEITVKK